MTHSIAVFDLDGTITRRDTFLPYLRGWLRHHPHRSWMWATVTALCRYAFSDGDRGVLKSDLIRRLMAGATEVEVTEWSREFVDGLDDEMLCPGALEAIERQVEMRANPTRRARDTDEGEQGQEQGQEGERQIDHESAHVFR